MPFIEVFLMGAGLSADAFAVSVANGFSLKNISRRQTLTIAVAFGLFQALMPVLGFCLGVYFADFITQFDHYIALIFLGFIGGKMIYDAIAEKEQAEIAEKSEISEILPLRTLILQAIATSIDAFVSGVVLLSMGVRGLWIIPAAATIGVTTFGFSYAGVGLGKKFGKLLGKKAKVIGGLVLIGIGLKVFVEHVFFGG